MVRKIVAEELHDAKKIMGTFLDESHYDILIEEDCDAYAPGNFDDSRMEDRVAFKFRKNFFSKEQQKEAYEGLRAAATPTNNRGTAAGTVRTGKNGNRVDNYISSTTYANEVLSGIAGAFGRVPRCPYGRLAAYNDRNQEMFDRGVPFLQTLDRAFADLLPSRHAAQKKFVNSIDEHFRIADTVFTTLTINKTFRTAAHLDAGDYGPGFSNLLVLSNDDNFTGGYLVLPEYRIAINVRPGDLLLIANHTAVHGNTPIVLGSETSERISIVAYAREDLGDLGTWEYEQTRKKFVEACRDNKEHPNWWSRFNGVYPGQWQSKEWFDYLIGELGEDEARVNDPKIFELHTTATKSNLDCLFE